MGWHVHFLEHVTPSARFAVITFLSSPRLVTAMTRLLSIRGLVSLPLLIALHIIFTLSSILLRLFQALAPSPAHTFATSQIDPPGHLALVLAPSHLSSSRPSTRTSISDGISEERDALVESVRRAVKWAGEEGIRELSIWDGQGMFLSPSSEIRAADCGG